MQFNSLSDLGHNLITLDWSYCNFHILTRPSGWSATRLHKVVFPRRNRTRSNLGVALLMYGWTTKDCYCCCFFAWISAIQPTTISLMLLLAVWLCVKTAEGLYSRIQCQSVFSSFLFQSVCFRNSDPKLFTWIRNPNLFISGIII